MVIIKIKKISYFRCFFLDCLAQVTQRANLRTFVNYEAFSTRVHRVLHPREESVLILASPGIFIDCKNEDAESIFNFFFFIVS